MDTSTVAPGGEELLLPRIAAKMLGVTTRTVSRWARAGLIEFTTTVGGHHRYPAGGTRGVLALQKRLREVTA